MSNAIAPAGTYVLKSFVISALTEDGRPNTQESSESIDLKAIVHTWDLSESMRSGAIQGTAKVYDTPGVFYKFPLRGQERLTIEYEDYFGEVRTENLFIFAITDVNPAGSASDDILEYKLHFCSFGKFFSDRFSVQRCIADGTGNARRYVPISEQIDTLFEDYYDDGGEGTEKSILIHETEGPQKIVIPNMTPENAIHLLARKAYNSEYPTHMYRFFENRDQYYFVNLEKWIEDYDEESILNFQYVKGPPDNTPQEEARRMRYITNMSFGTYVNTMNSLTTGAYYRNTYEIDLNNRRTIDNNYSHKEEFKNYLYAHKENERIHLRHTDQFIDQHLNNSHTTYVFKDYPDSDAPQAYGLRPRTNFAEIMNTRAATLFNMNENNISVTIFGHNKVVAGSIIDVEIPEFKDQNDVDVRVSGRYLVESVKNVFVENNYFQNLILIRGPQLSRNRRQSNEQVVV